jgi:hypothetical protein
MQMNQTMQPMNSKPTLLAKIFLAVCIWPCVIIPTFGQTTLTLDANYISDATIRQDQRVGMEYIANTNYRTLQGA